MAQKGDTDAVLVGCKICKEATLSAPNFHCAWSEFTIPVDDLSKCRLMSHAKSQKHITSCSVKTPGPTLEEFRKVWDSFGLASTEIKRWRAERMSWCVSEALKERSCKHLKKADAVGLIRDERHGRLLIRYRTVTLRGLELKTGVVGQAKHFGTGADNISKATVKLIEQALTAKTGIPDDDSRCRRSADSDHDQLQCRRLAEEVLGKVEMLCVDSASDELLSGQVMRYGQKMTPPRLMVSLQI